MPDFAYQTPEELREIDPDLVAPMIEGNPIFEFFPRTPVENDRLVWEVRDNYGGLQQVRGLNGEPPRVVPVGARKYSFEPGVYGEYMDVDELEMTRRASRANRAMRIDISDLVSERQEQLVARQTNRQAWIGWQLLGKGRFVVLNDAGAVVHADAYDQQVFIPTVPWTTLATATPMADFRAVARVPRGTSASLGASATAWMNQITFDDMVGNTNPADLGGRKVGEAQNRPQSEADANTIFLGSGLPRVRIYDDGYQEVDGTWRPWLDDGEVVVVGRRTNNARLGEFRMTPNVNNPDAEPGEYSKVIDYLETKVPRKIEVHRGFNGGAVIFYPGAVMVMRTRG